MGYREKVVKLANRVFIYANNLYRPPESHKEVTFTLGEFIDFIVGLVKPTVQKYEEKIIKVVGEEHFEEIKSTGKVDDLIASDIVIEWGTKKPEDIAETLEYYNFRPQDKVGVSGGWRDYSRYILEEIWETCNYLKEHPEERREIDLDKMILKIKMLVEKKAKKDVYNSVRKEGYSLEARLEFFDNFVSKRPTPEENFEMKEKLRKTLNRTIYEIFQDFSNIPEKYRKDFLEYFFAGIENKDKLRFYNAKRTVKKILGERKERAIEGKLEKIREPLDLLGVTPEELASRLKKMGVKIY